MSDVDLDRLRQVQHESGLGELVSAEDLERPLTPDEWREEARRTEADLDAYPDERIEILCEAGNAWQQAGDLDEADRCYRLAAECEHEPGLPDPRIYYASFLVESYDAARGDELLAEIWASRPTNSGTYHFVAETLETISAYERALTWVNAGLSRCYPDLISSTVDEVLEDPGLDMLLTTRARVRGALDQPEDALDELSGRSREAFRAALDSYERNNPVSRPPAVLFWPEAEFTEVVSRWPDSLTGARALAATHAEHRAEVEKLLRDSAEGETPLLIRGDVGEFAEFCGERERDPSSASSRDDYASWLAEEGYGVEWPPGRNEPCWCGSGRKYKKCCGAPGFAEG